MKTAKTYICQRLLVILMMMIACHVAYAQGITLSTTNTSTICFNDGSLTVSASGGTAPYTYTITAGPSNPNISYPIVLPFGQNIFRDMPHGTFTVVVTDASGATGTFQAPVGGTYEFPSMIFDTVSIPGIICIASDGTPPYQYAVSSTGANSGFGPYQSSDTFATICPGHYWLRVRDSCQNIFTNVTTFSYYISGNVNCANFSKGTMSVSGYGGHPPYTYSYGSVNSTTGNFTALPAYFTGNVTITDSCGIQGYLGVGPYPVPLFESCASDSNIYVNPYFQGYDFNYDTLTFICTNCTPVQSATVISSYATVDTLFQHIAPGYNYNIVILSPDCGGDTLPFSLSQSQPTALSADYSPTSCYSFQVTAFPMLDSVILRDSTGAIVQVSYTGYFYQLPAGNYTASVYGDSASTPCDIDSAALYITLPFFASACETMMKDSTCQTSWQLTLSDDSYFYDTYSLIDGSGDTIPGIVPVSYYYNPLTYFFNLTPGSTYTLVSDSGCSMQYTLDPIPPVPTTAITYVPCVGLARILPSNQYLGIGCNNFYYNVYLNDSLVQYIPLSDGSFEVSDSGWYTIRWYAQSYDTAGNIIGYDTLCPVDTNLIYVSNSHVPYPYPSSAYVCDSNNTDTVIYHIYGGDIPYTVEVLGYDTVILNTNTGTFPTNIPGQYTMIVYDNCGISRSITFSVIDTCQGCPLGGISMPDTLYCAGDTVHLTDASLGAVAYEWYINGAPYSAARDTTFITPAGDYKILLLVYGRSGCQDSGVVRFTAVSPLSVSLGADTSYCDTFSRVLSTGIPSTVWSTGQTGAQITVTNPGRYSAMVFNKCGAHTDSVTITTDPVASLTLTPVQATICSDRMDTVILYAAVDSSLQAPFTFMWGGQTDSGVYSASYLVDSAGSYQVTVRDSFCSATRLAVISPMVCDSDSNSIARPSAFTPNGDQKNDVFFVPHTGDIYSFSLEIHDQWGQQVYQSTDVNQGWDGTYRGKPQPEGVYIWFTCDKLYSTSKENCTSGTVMLLR